MQSAPYFDDGKATLYGCDMMAMLGGLPSGSVDAIITDPPYSSGGRTAGERQRSTRKKYVDGSASQLYRDRMVDFAGDERDQRSYLRWMDLWLTDAMPALRDGGLVMLFSDWRQLPLMTDAIQAAGVTWRGIIPWYKSNSRHQPGRFANSCEYVVWGSKGQAAHLDVPDKPASCRSPTYSTRNACTSPRSPWVSCASWSRPHGQAARSSTRSWGPAPPGSPPWPKADASLDARSSATTSG